MPVITFLLPSVVLLGFGLMLSAGQGFPQLHPVRLIKDVKKTGKSGLTYFWLSLGGIMGAGNIAGVATAIKLGGKGAVFWMMLGALVCAPVKYAEIFTAVKCKIATKNAHGGGMYYMKGKVLPMIFCILMVTSSFTTGNMVQFGAVAQGSETLCIPVYIPAIIFCGLFALVTLVVPNGAARFSSFAVPVMTVLYLTMCTGILICRLPQLPTALCDIVNDAFGFDSALSGTLSGLLLSARYGLASGLLSHEAGMGTSPIAHCENKQSDPDASGKLGILEVYADTLVGAFLTALCIIVTDTDSAFDAFESVYPFGGLVLISCLCLFALSSAVTWHFYGCRCVEYVVQNGIQVYKSTTVNSVRGKQLYTAVFVALSFASFFLPVVHVYALADLTNCVLAIVNTITVGNTD